MSYFDDDFLMKTLSPTVGSRDGNAAIKGAGKNFIFNSFYFGDFNATDPNEFFYFTKKKKIFAIIPFLCDRKKDKISIFLKYVAQTGL